MNRIRLLPEQVANQIAAGEVVERPASAVKELVENALDAESSHISVEIMAGGRSLIRVTDDGTGMSRDDALLSLERHATSKIVKSEDLAAIRTMGFRGEALPSIASVSRFTLTTRERDSGSPEGTQINIAAGKILEVKAAGLAPGTCIEVRQLFYNLPARRKFLRTEETESAHIQHYLTLAALAFTDVAFTFKKDGRLLWQLPAIKSGNQAAGQSDALRERLRELYSEQPRLLPVDYKGRSSAIVAEANDDSETDQNFHIWGVIGAPGVSRATRDEQHLFVNRRPVENRGLNYALLEGYHTALMKGRYPVCCLFLQMDPAAVDVNIHPAKREVKFHQEGEVRRFVTRAIKETLLKFHNGPSEPVQMVSNKQVALPNLPAAIQPRPIEHSSNAAQETLRMGFASASAAPGLSQSGIVRQPLFQPEPGQRTEQPAITQKVMVSPTTATVPVNLTNVAPIVAPPVSSSFPSQLAEPLLKVPLRLVGVIGKLYVVLESDRGLVLLDQHAAHERILFEQMLQRLEKETQAPSQRLLLPETVELSARDALFLREQLPMLTRLGVGLSEFGERTFLLDALPPFVKVAEPKLFVRELIDQLKAAGQEVNTLRLGEHTVAKTVCRHAVKANDPLGGLELENLVADLRRCAMPYTCPHGRPTLIEMNFKELEKKFGRTQ
jgi:DNA mismatch repair protein MutL